MIAAMSNEHRAMSVEGEQDLTVAIHYSLFTAHCSATIGSSNVTS